ncbi:MAG: hypothetical protein DMD35_08935 [Gemmatimonadetes bacterium]|nr:MAG: hypothetical protein DMD35_08935 [Gemmatimonadota bacterium]
MSDAPPALRTDATPRDDRAAQAVRLGGLGAVLAGVVFLGTIAYTFGFLFARGLSTDMLNEPARLLPWVHANTVAYVGLWWIYTLHFFCLLPAPRGLAVIVGADRARIRMATIAGIAGAVVGTIAAQVNAATAPPLAAASVATAPALLPSVWLQSELAGGLGLQLRLLSDLLMAVWLTATGLTLARMAGWRALGLVQLAVSALVVVVYVGKPFDWLDLEPMLGFILALVYLWIGVQLLRQRVNW